jgi:hypothetical protein
MVNCLTEFGPREAIQRRQANGPRRTPQGRRAVDIVLINRPELPPAGAGESSIHPVAAALANAVFDASGVRLRRAPERLKPALASFAGPYRGNHARMEGAGTAEDAVTVPSLQLPPLAPQ